MDILIKFPTRGRPLLFFKTLLLHMQMLSGKHNVEFLIAMDEDDESMNNQLVKDFLCQIQPPSCQRTVLNWFYKEHKGKVDAVNSGISDHEFDIVLVTSDDIEPRHEAWDMQIVQDYIEYFPDFDGITYYRDGRCVRKDPRSYRPTIPIFGKNIYRKLGFIVHPEFISWGDNYSEKLWRSMGKLQFINDIILEHKWAKYNRMDDTYKRASRNRCKDARTFKRLNDELQESIKGN